MTEVSLEMPGRLVQRPLDGQAAQDQLPSRMEAALGEIRDELLVTTTIVMRLEARQVETAGLMAL